MVRRSPPDNHIGIFSFTRLDPGCGDARAGELSKCFAHNADRIVVFTIKNSTGRSPIFILTFSRHFADRIVVFTVKISTGLSQIFNLVFPRTFADSINDFTVKMQTGLSQIFNLTLFPDLRRQH